MSLYCSDQITHYIISEDENGVKTKTSNGNFNCQITDNNELVFDESNNNNGSEIRSKSLIMFDEDFNIKENDEIKIIKRFNENVTDNNFYKAIKVHKPSGIKFSHLEVYI